MFKVIIKNQEKNLEWAAILESQELAQEWLNKQIGKPHRLPERSITNEDGSISVLPAEFTYEIIDLTKNNEWVLNDLREKRRKEYPSETEIIEALMEDKEGRPEKLNEVIKKRNAIKLKYPVDEKLKNK